jgi:hypothetical protein
MRHRVLHLSDEEARIKSEIAETQERTRERNDLEGRSNNQKQVGETTRKWMSEELEHRRQQIGEQRKLTRQAIEAKRLALLQARHADFVLKKEEAAKARVTILQARAAKQQQKQAQMLSVRERHAKGKERCATFARERLDVVKQTQAIVDEKEVSETQQSLREVRRCPPHARTHRGTPRHTAAHSLRAHRNRRVRAEGQARSRCGAVARRTAHTATHADPAASSHGVCGLSRSLCAVHGAAQLEMLAQEEKRLLESVHAQHAMHRKEFDDLQERHPNYRIGLHTNPAPFALHPPLAAHSPMHARRPATSLSADRTDAVGLTTLPPATPSSFPPSPERFCGHYRYGNSVPSSPRSGYGFDSRPGTSSAMSMSAASVPVTPRAL